MIPYWLLFLFPAYAVIAPIRVNAHVRTIAFGLFAAIATIIIGLRYEVGGDWGAYLNYVETVSGIDLLDAIFLRDPGYMAITWLSANTGMGIFGVNIFGGAIFVLGLIRFCRAQPYPWIGIAVATPFLLIVVAMGYSRQAIALGFVFWALSVWKDEGIIKYASLIVLAALFHKAASVMFLFVLFKDRQNLLYKWVLGLPAIVIIFYVITITSTFEAQWNEYIVEKSYHSEGGFIRVIMNVMPALLLLLLRDKFSVFGDLKLWVLVSIACILLMFLVPFFSTVVDRFSVFLAPIQIVVYSRIPMMVRSNIWRSAFCVAVLISYGSALWVWLNYAAHAEYWVPYRWAISQ